MAFMAMRLGSVIIFLMLPVAIGCAAAQVPGADATPYPMETDQPAAQPAKPTAHKPLTFPASAKALAKPAVTETAAMPAKSAAATLASVPVALPPIKPSATKPGTSQATLIKSDPTGDVFAGIPQDERLKLQAALLWSGDYAGAINGEDPMLTAVNSSFAS